MAQEISQLRTENELLQNKLNQVAISIREALEEFTDYDELKTCLEFILEELER